MFQLARPDGPSKFCSAVDDGPQARVSLIQLGDREATEASFAISLQLVPD